MGERGLNDPRQAACLRSALHRKGPEASSDRAIAYLPMLANENRPSSGRRAITEPDNARKRGAPIHPAGGWTTRLALELQDVAAAIAMSMQSVRNR
jgi:hypothetical protein